MIIKLTRDEIHQHLTTNMQDWKKYADINEAQDLNEELTPDEISIICSPAFLDDATDAYQDLAEVLDKHFLDPNLSVYSTDIFVLIHNIYNV